jgi:hypothetical protein
MQGNGDKNTFEMEKIRKDCSRNLYGPGKEIFQIELVRYERFFVK